MQLNFNELRELLLALNQTNISELTLKSGEFELSVRKDLPGGGLAASESANSVDLSAILAAIQPTVALPTTPAVAPVGEVAAQSAPTPSPSAPPPVPADKRWVEVTSPMVGTFYRAPGPDESPFVEVGDRIRVGQTVCIIEAMKLMNELDAEVAGEVMEILVQNGQPVEYGQVLMRVNPG